MEAFKDAIMAHAVYYPVVEILSSIAIACVIWFGGNRRDCSGVDATHRDVLVGFIQYAQRFFRPIQDLSEKYNILQSAMAASERVFKLLDTPVEITSPAQPKTPTGPGRIEFDHVWFAYRNVPRGRSARNASAANGQTVWTSDLASEARRTEPDWILRDVSSPSNRARPSPSSATPAQARPPSSRC